MNEFEYYHGFETILYGLAIAILFTGVGKMVIHSKAITYYWIHILMIAVAFFTLVEAYFGMYHIQDFYQRSYGTETKWLFFLVKVLPVGSMYMAIMTLFPENYEQHIDFRKLFENRDRKILFYIIVVIGSTIIKDLIIYFPNQHTFVEIVAAENFMTLIIPPAIFILISITALLVRKNHQFIATLTVILFIYMMWLMSIPPILPE